MKKVKTNQKNESGRALWTIWKEGNRDWKVQFPKGIMTFKTKRTATKVANSFASLDAE
ncbi:MAG: hypothetical protein GY847_01675 [Proteobacteria bacterium]|nr:hypothetical protein [Pseudomonadota bacterium]